jgi:AmiR/NasT family two-component response regulator
MGGDISDVANADVSGTISAFVGAGVGNIVTTISKTGIQAAVRTGITTGVVDSILMVSDPVFADVKNNPSSNKSSFSGTNNSSSGK